MASQLPIRAYLYTLHPLQLPPKNVVTVRLAEALLCFVPPPITTLQTEAIQKKNKHTSHLEKQEKEIRHGSSAGVEISRQ